MTRYVHPSNRAYDERTPEQLAEAMEWAIRANIFREKPAWPYSGATVGRLAGYIGTDPRKVFEVAMTDDRFKVEIAQISGIDTARVKLSGKSNAS